MGGARPTPSFWMRRDQFGASGNGIAGARQDAAGLLHVEIRLGDLQQGVVLGPLHVEIAALEESLLRQGSEDGVGHGEDGLSADAGQELVAGAVLIQAGAVQLLAAVVPLVVGAEVDSRQPQSAGLLRTGRIPS